MHSWIFRHRAELRRLYGPKPEALPAPLPAHAGASDEDRNLERVRARGSFERRGSSFWMHPQAPLVGVLGRETG